MLRIIDNRKALIALTIIVAFVAVVVPTCRMIGCSMEMTGYMGFMHGGADLGFFSDCGGTWTTSTTPIGIVPAAIESLLLALVALVAAVAARFSPTLAVSRVRVVYATPPPPPQDPRGERLRI